MIRQAFHWYTRLLGIEPLTDDLADWTAACFVVLLSPLILPFIGAGWLMRRCLGPQRGTR